ncbi:type VII secretion target [Mycolicibacterium fortuitum]|uniref:type VII secretion target n=1 Tax=Mycolicibacterium fortuitum TaxID=1766 RepID=UPI000942D2EC|nr:type VII secretion target [Mycolicibacterium fortuitum]
MADDLRVDPSELRMASDHLGVAAADHATETARHRDEFVDGVARWRGGASVSALRAVAEQWEARHSHRQQQVNTLERNISEAAQRYTATDDGAAESITAVPIIGNAIDL